MVRCARHRSTHISTTVYRIPFSHVPPTVHALLATACIPIPRRSISSPGPKAKLRMHTVYAIHGHLRTPLLSRPPLPLPSAHLRSSASLLSERRGCLHGV